MQDAIGCLLTWLEDEVQCWHLLEGKGEGAEEVQSRGHHEQGHRAGGRQEAAVQQRLLVGVACHITQHRPPLQLVHHLQTTIVLQQPGRQPITKAAGRKLHIVTVLQQSGKQAGNHQRKQASWQAPEPEPQPTQKLISTL